jgi:hypothetical protein
MSMAVREWKSPPDAKASIIDRHPVMLARMRSSSCP